MNQRGHNYPERWRPIVGYEGLYSISSLGRVWSKSRRVRSRFGTRLLRGRVLRPGDDGAGYLQLGLRNEKKRKTFRIHILVLTSFVGPCPEGLEACHNNGDRYDNKLTNLRWDTRKNNHADKLRHGTAQRGERIGTHKLTEATVKLLRRKHAIGGMSVPALAKWVGAPVGTVYDVVARKTWAYLV